MDITLIKEYVAFLRDIMVVVLTFPIIILIRNFYKQQVNTLKSQIELLNELKSDNVVAYIRAYKELSIIDREKFFT